MFEFLQIMAAVLAFLGFAMLVETVADKGFARGILVLGFTGLAFVGASILAYIAMMVIP